MRIARILTSLLLACAGSAAAQEVAQPPASGAVRLVDLQAEAESKHPSIHAAARMVQAMRARVPQARSLPDPSVAVGWMGNITPFDVQNGDPSSFRAISAMQELPYPGKLRLRGELMEKGADAEAWNVVAARRRVRSEVAVAFYGLWATEKALGITRRNKDLLEKLARIAEEKYKVGRGIQPDVLRAHVEVTRLLQRITVLEQQQRTFEAKLNSLLLRPPTSSLGQPEEVERSLLPYSLDELLDRAVATAPEVRRQEEMIEQSQVAMDLARREYYPDFNVGYMYQQRPGMPDMHGFTVGIKIPVFYRSKQRQAVEEASLTMASVEQMRESIRTALVFQVKEQFLAARASEELLTLYAKGIVPQSSLALESALASYQTGELDFLSVINNFVTVLDYEIAYYQELASYQQALARLEEITGISLTAPAAPGK